MCIVYCAIPFWYRYNFSYILLNPNSSQEFKLPSSTTVTVILQLRLQKQLIEFVFIISKVCRVAWLKYMSRMSCMCSCSSVSKYDRLGNLSNLCEALKDFLFTFCEWFETSSTNLWATIEIKYEWSSGIWAYGTWQERNRVVFYMWRKVNWVSNCTILRNLYCIASRKWS